jgi:hypothetical protein
MQAVWAFLRKKQRLFRVNCARAEESTNSAQQPLLNASVAVEPDETIVVRIKFHVYDILWARVMTHAQEDVLHLVGIVLNVYHNALELATQDGSLRLPFEQLGSVRQALFLPHNETVLVLDCTHHAYIQRVVLFLTEPMDVLLYDINRVLQLWAKTQTHKRVVYKQHA